MATGPAQGMVRSVGPDPEWRNEADCGFQTYKRADGSVIPLNCAGPAHVYWRDLDGTLFSSNDNSGSAKPSAYAGIFVGGPRVFPEDQGTPVLPGPCAYSSATSSYRCEANSTSFLLDTRLKPNPVPAKGIFGDPQHFVLESLDADSEDRNFGPVMFNVSGSIDLVVTAMDQVGQRWSEDGWRTAAASYAGGAEGICKGAKLARTLLTSASPLFLKGWCFAYTCQKRLSTFWTYLPTGQTTYVNFTGTPAQNFRVWLPYADPNSEIVLVFNMLYTLNRRFVVIPPGMGNFTGRVVPESAPVKIGDGKGHGAYFWDQDNTLLYVKVKGGKTLELRTESIVMVRSAPVLAPAPASSHAARPAIQLLRAALRRAPADVGLAVACAPRLPACPQVSQSFALTIDQFYSTQQIFIQNLADVMNISSSRIFVAKVVPGSVTLSTALAPKASTTAAAIPERTIDLSRFQEPDNTTSTPTAAAAPPPPPSAKAAEAGDLVDAVLAYQRALSDPNIANKLGAAPMGSFKVDTSAITDPATQVSDCCRAVLVARELVIARVGRGGVIVGEAGGGS